MKKLRVIGLVTTCGVGLSCGADFVGRAIQDAGLSSSTRVSRALKPIAPGGFGRFSLVNNAGTGFVQEISVDSGGRALAEFGFPAHAEAVVEQFAHSKRIATLGVACPSLAPGEAV